jgi:drug/metabolite transporter (DMT)-like permease
LSSARRDAGRPAAAPPGGRDRAITPQVWAALVTVYILWGSTYLAIREAVMTMPPFLMGSTRYLVAGALLYGVASARGDRRGDRPTLRQWRSAAIAGALLMLGGNGLVVWAETRIPSGITALVVASVPLWMVVISAVVLRDRISRREAFGLVVGFGGIVLLVGGPGSGGFDLTGVLAVVCAAASWATGSLYARRADLPSRPLVATGMQMLAGGAMLLVLGLAFGEAGDVHLSQISLPSWLGLLWLIGPGSIVAFSAYVWLLRNAPISLVGTYAYVNPVVAVFLGWLFLSEPIHLTTLLAGAVIVVAVALIVSARRPPRVSEGSEGDEEASDAEPALGHRVGSGERADVPVLRAATENESTDDDAA